MGHTMSGYHACVQQSVLTTPHSMIMCGQSIMSQGEYTASFYYNPHRHLIPSAHSLHEYVFRLSNSLLYVPRQLFLRIPHLIHISSRTPGSRPPFTINFSTDSKSYGIVMEMLIRFLLSSVSILALCHPSQDPKSRESKVGATCLWNRTTVA